MSTRLSKIKLHLTPRRVAVQYFEWVWGFPRTREPTPLRGLLKRMESDLRSRLEDPVRSREAGINSHRSKTANSAGRGVSSSAAPRYYRVAENEVYFLLELYTLTVTEWFKEVSALLQLNQIALATITSPVSSPELLKRIVDQYDRVLIVSHALDMIQTRYLRLRVQPPDFYLMVALLPTEFSLTMLCLISSGSGDNINVLGLEECRAEARAEVEALVAIAQQSACSANAKPKWLATLASRQNVRSGLCPRAVGEANHNRAAEAPSRSYSCGSTH